MKRWMKHAAACLTLTAAANAQVFTITPAGDKVGNSDMASMVWLNSHGLGDTITAAAKLKARPAGMRCLFLWADNHAICNDPADLLPGKFRTLWWPAGITKSLADENLLIAQMKSANVKPDYIVLDDESFPCRWNLTAANIAAIANDPRGKALGVPKVLSDEAEGLKFDLIVGASAYAALNEGIFRPLLAYAPNASVGQFGCVLINAAEGLVIRDINSHVIGGDALPMTGNTQEPSVYGSLGGNPQTQTPYGVAMYSENILRAGTHHGPILPWYSGDGIDRAVWAGTNYWGESIRHGLLTCGLRGLLFDADQPTAAAKFSVIYLETKQAVGGTMPTTMCSPELLDFAAPFYVTARADRWDGVIPASKVVGRVTFAPGVTIANFSVAGRDFSVKPAAGQAGAWFNYNTTTTAPTKTTTTTTTTKKGIGPSKTVDRDKRKIIPH